ncbi:hypothetical protein NLG97_g11343 [Lecanicillium saksenae]|uniref:Uncharacterized protein n=1 Tax=Lecanicillium saksenae TaxID=468837 RepID=A0ACC1QBY3_9HYPO|nr:hypothetical protein NLG97_g11343 [Lecanicillium saksenae]
MIDLGLKLVYPNDLPRFVYYPDHLVKMPPTASIFDCLSEDLFRECIWGALGTVASYIMRRADGGIPDKDMSVAEWIRGITMGDTVGNNLVSAMIHGIYGGDIDRLSASRVLDRMYYQYHLPPAETGKRWMPVHELTFMKHMCKDELICAEANKPKGSLIHFGKYGMESLPKAIEDALTGQSNVNIQRQAAVTKITPLRKDNKVEVRHIMFAINLPLSNK